MVISVHNKDAFKKDIIFHLIYGINNAIFLKKYFNILMKIYILLSFGCRRVCRLNVCFVHMGLYVISSVMVIFQKRHVRMPALEIRPMYM